MKKKIRSEKDKSESDLSEKKPFQKKSNKASWAVFLFTLSVVLVSLTSVVFPSLIASNNSILIGLGELGIDIGEADPFEFGSWGIPLIITDLVIFGIAILYFKKKLPLSLNRFFNFIFTFEVSKRVAILAIIGLLAIYIAASAGELEAQEEWEDFPGVKQRVDNWAPDQITRQFETHARYFLLWASMILFGNYRIIPFLASIALILTTYFITKEIAKKRFAGLVAMVIVLQSTVFLTYDSTVSYTNFWILFYLLSLFLIFKLWPLSPVFYFLSLLSKPLTGMFFPMSLFFIFRSPIPKIRKIIIASSITVLILAGGIAAIVLDFDLTGGGSEGFNSDEFWLGFTSFSYQLRFDGLVLLFILPLIVGLYLSAKNGIIQAESIMILVGVLLLTAPILTGFTDLTNQPYRFVPLVVFFAMGVGTLISKRNEF